VTASGDVYVADAGNQTIRKVAPTGATVTYAGANGQSGSTDGAATAARFITPFGLAADAQGNLRERGTRDNSGSALGEIPLLRRSVVGIEPGSDDGTKDCIAEEFQALVIRRSPFLMAT
jgi:hypothetical protein